jgi:hypothetical protein
MADCLPRRVWVRGVVLALALLNAGRIAIADEEPLHLLAAVLCERGDSYGDFRGGFLPMMGFAATVHPMLVLRSRDRYLMVPAEQCRDGRANEKVRLIIWHIVRRGEGLYYLAGLTGGLLVAVEGVAANTANYTLASTHDPDIMIDFANEKAFWLAAVARAER